MRWWKVIKLAITVAVKVGRVKEKDRVTEIVDALDVVVTAATTPDTPAAPAQKGQ